jgi:uncharacterized membrane protein
MAGKKGPGKTVAKASTPGHKLPANNSAGHPAAKSITLQQSSFRGPLPHPEHLREYADIYPDAPRIIFGMAERQSDHRQGLEKYALRHSTIRAYGGLVAGVIVALAGLAAAVVVAIYASAVAGAVIGTFDLASLVGVFVYGTRQVQENRRSKLGGNQGGNPEQLPLWS